MTTPRAGAQASRLLQQLDDVKREMDCLEQEVQGKDREIELLNKYECLSPLTSPSCGRLHVDRVFIGLQEFASQGFSLR